MTGPRCSTQTVRFDRSPLSLAVSRAVMLLSALSAHALVPAASASTACEMSAPTQACTGDQAAGILGSGDIETLTIGELSTSIAPSDGIDGVSYTATGHATLLSDTGSFEVRVTNARGIDVSSVEGNTYVSHQGDVTVTGGQGIVASADNGEAAIEGGGSVSATADALFTNPKGGDATINWDGDLSSSGGRAIYIMADNGAATVSGRGVVESDQTAVTVDARGNNGVAVFNWDGNITSYQGAGVSMNGANGGASVLGQGVVVTHLDGFNLATTGVDDDVTLKWNGAITSTTGAGAWVRATDGGATIEGSGDVQAALDGLYLEAIGDNATLDWSGAVSSSTGYGIFADADTGGSTVKGSGTVTGVLGGIVAQNRSASTSIVDWQGDVTATAGSGIEVTSSSGGTTLKGSGQVTAQNTGIRVRNTGSRTASVAWVGNVTGTDGFGVEVYSSNAAVAIATTGNVLAGTGGVFGFSEGESNDNVSIAHIGDITAGGVGVEARSPLAATSVSVIGDIHAGSYGIYALSEGISTVAVSMTGDIVHSGHAGIDARSPQGAVNVSQSGALTTLDTGIHAHNESQRTVSVAKTGDLTAALDGIHVSSTQGVATVTAQQGVFDVGGVAVRASNLGDTSVNVRLLADVTRSTSVIDASSSNGAVYLTTEGDFTASGDAITARSGGAGEVAITHQGDLAAVTGSAIVAESVSGNVNVSLSDGAITAGHHGLHLSGSGNFSAQIAQDATLTGGDGYAAVLFEGGFSNAISNRGIIANAGGIDASAIDAEGNDLLIDNFGTLSGNIVLGPYANALRNHASGVLETGSVLTMASGDTLENSGTLSIGGSDRAMTTALTGSLSLSEGSQLLLDVDMAQTANPIDRINVSGNASLTGDVALNFVSVGNAPSRYTFVAAEGDVATPSLVLASLPFVDAEISHDATTIDLVINGLDFTQEGITGNARRVAQYFEQTLASGETGVSELGGYIANLDSIEAGQQVLEQLPPDVVVASLTQMQAEGIAFADTLKSCRVASGLHASIAEGDCDWIRPTYSKAELKSSESSAKSTAESSGFTAGFQRSLGFSPWLIGGGFGLYDSETVSDTSWTESENQLSGGLIAKYASGSYVLSAGVSNTWGDMRMMRTVNLGDETQILMGTTDTGTTDINLRAAYALDFDHFYLKPQLDLHALRMRADAYTETGGSTALAIEAMDRRQYTVAPSLELGADRLYDDGRVMRGFVKVGATVLTGESPSVRGRLASDTASDEFFEIDFGMDRTLLDVGLGVVVFSTDGFSTEVMYEGQFSDQTEEHTLAVKMRVHF